MAAHALIFEHSHRVDRLARRFGATDEYRSELRAAGIEALIRAAGSFDEARGAFWPYARVAVRRAMCRALNALQTVRPPYHRPERGKNAMIPVDLDDVAPAISMSPEDVLILAEELMARRRRRGAAPFVPAPDAA